VVSLERSKEYATGKVAIVSGTAGTAAVTVSIAPSTYKDAAGLAVSVTAARQFVFLASGAPCRCEQDYIKVESADSVPCASRANGFDDDFYVQTTAGTASYTLVIYGT
jgi:hypothetical protein